jgi:hypothetical protein
MDNKGTLLVTVFAFVPATETDFSCQYRDRAIALYKVIIPGLILNPLETMYRDTRNALSALYLECKNACHTLLAP